MIGLADGQAFPVEEAAQLGFPSVHKAGLHWEIDLRDGQSIDPVVAMLQSRGLNLRHLVEKRQTLEDLFVQTVEAAEPGVDKPARRPRPLDDRVEDRPRRVRR